MKNNEDPQARLVYKWEDSFTAWAGAHMSERAVLDTVEQASNKYRIPIPAVRFSRVGRRAGRKLPSTYTPLNHTITLVPRHMNGAVVLHETAHAITDYLLGWDLESHGPEWLGVYMVLLEEFEISPRVALHASADAAGLEYRGREIVGPAVIRKRYRRRFKLAKDWR